MDGKKGQAIDALLQRRAILKLLTGMPVGALFSVGPRATASGKETAAQPASTDASAPYQPKTFNPHEWKTVHVLCDLIIPADERSAGATAAGVPEFIDDWLEFQGGDLLPTIRGGLAWLDVECRRQFHNDFTDASDSQRRQILDRIAYPKKAAPEDANAVAFFNRFRDLVVSGFFTSETGIRDLPYQGNEPRSVWRGCPSSVLTQLGLVNESTKA